MDALRPEETDAVLASIDSALKAAPDFDLSLTRLPRKQGFGDSLLKRGLNYFHEGLADYIIVNPGATLKEIGAYFGYTPSWICQVINSDLFQAYLGQRRDQVSSQVAQSLPEKLKAAAHVATERLAEIAANSIDEKVAVDAADKILHRYGYAPNAKGGAQAQGNVNIQQNNFYLSKGELSDARSKLIEAHNGEVVQGGPGGQASEVLVLPAVVHNPET